MRHNSGFMVSKNKLGVIASLVVVLLVEAAFSLYVSAENNRITVDRGLILISTVCWMVFVIHILLWKKLTGEMLCAYTVFLLCLFVFCCGQSLGWSLGFNMGSKDMWDRIDHGIDRKLLTSGMIYSMLGITCFQLGAVLAYKKDRYKRNALRWSQNQILGVYKQLGKLLLIICIPAFVAQNFQVLLAVANGGYSAYYDTLRNRSIIMKIAGILGDYYQPCMLLLLIAYKDKKLYRRIIVGMMLLDVVGNLYIGGRSGAVMTILGIIIAYHYFIKPFSFKQITSGVVVGYFGLGALNYVADIRSSTSRDIATMLTGFGASLTNVIGTFIGELGWNITSICWTMELVPARYPFRHGMSYLVSLVSWVPSAFFGGLHPCVVWANIGDWLQSALGMSYGPGYTMIAESYINFGWFGLAALVVEGAIISLIIARDSRVHVVDDTLGATFQVIVIMTIMKSLVRSSVSVAVRSSVFVIIPLYLIIRYTLSNKRRNQVENRNIDLV